MKNESEVNDRLNLRYEVVTLERNKILELLKRTKGKDSMSTFYGLGRFLVDPTVDAYVGMVD